MCNRDDFEGGGGGDVDVFLVRVGGIVCARLRKVCRLCTVFVCFLCTFFILSSFLFLFFFCYLHLLMR